MPGKLIYFDLGGRAEGIRMLLSHAGHEYEDCNVTYETFSNMRADNELPLGSLPVWEEEGYSMVQSSSILRMLGIRLDYYATDDIQCWAIDSIVDFIEGL